MVLQLFKHLKGYSVLHGSPGQETPETIEAITKDNHKDYLTIEFQSGKFTHILLGQFDYWLENGTIQYLNTIDINSIESLKDSKNK